MSGRLSQPPDCPGCFSDFLGESGSVAGNSGRWPDGAANATDPGTSTGAFGCGVPVTSITAGVSLSLKIQGSGSASQVPLASNSCQWQVNGLIQDLSPWVAHEQLPPSHCSQPQEFQKRPQSLVHLQDKLGGEEFYKQPTRYLSNHISHDHVHRRTWNNQGRGRSR